MKPAFFFQSRKLLSYVGRKAYFFTPTQCRRSGKYQFVCATRRSIFFRCLRTNFMGRKASARFTLISVHGFNRRSPAAARKTHDAAARKTSLELWALEKLPNSQANTSKRT